MRIGRQKSSQCNICCSLIYLDGSRMCSTHFLFQKYPLTIPWHRVTVRPLQVSVC